MSNQAIISNQEDQLNENEIKNENNQDINQQDLKKLQQVLIPSLQNDVSFLAEKYNKEILSKEKEKVQVQQVKSEVAAEPVKLRADATGRAGGVYVPPFKLAILQAQIVQQNQKQSQEYQKLMWELLRKSINGIINKVNISNIQYVTIELLNENILRGKGLLARAIIKAQMASPNFSHVYAALVAVINTKLPEIANLVIKRVILQFQKAYKRNNKIVCMATTKMLGHLINQKVLSDFLGLQLLALLLENPTEDSVEIACDFMIECGQILSELTPAGVNAIFERFKGILHEGEIDRRVQYSIENLFAVRKTKFAEHAGVLPELDLVEEDDVITHNINLDDEDLDPEDNLNIFKFDPFYEKTEEEWNEIKLEILGEENVLRLKTLNLGQDDIEEEQDDDENQKILDFTEEDRKNLRRTLYLVIMNSLDFEECVHKIMKMNIGTGHEDEVSHMLIECCMEERTYLRFYGLLAQRLCQINELYQQQFFKCFIDEFTIIHRQETNRLRNVAKFFAHLLFTDSIDWKVLQCIRITQDKTTSSSRIFIKILFQELSEHLGLEKFWKRLSEPENFDYFAGIFPKDHPRNTRFAINFFTSIGLGALTEDMRKFLDEISQKLMAEKQQLEQEGSSSSSDDDSSDEDESSENQSNSSDNEIAGKKQPESDSDKDITKQIKEVRKKVEETDQRKIDKPKEKEKEKERGKDRDRERQRDRDKEKEKVKRHSATPEQRNKKRDEKSHHKKEYRDKNDSRDRSVSRERDKKIKDKKSRSRDRKEKERSRKRHDSSSSSDNRRRRKK